MSIEDFRNVVHKKNLDQTFEVLADTLETIGGSGGSITTLILNAGSSEQLPISSGEIHITTTDAQDTQQPVKFWMPRGTLHGDRLKIIWVNDISEGLDLGIAIFGYNISDFTLVYQFDLTKVDFSLGGMLVVEWNEQYGSWRLVDFYSVSGFTQSRNGATTEYVDFNDTFDSHTIRISERDAYVEYIVDQTTNHQNAVTIPVNEFTSGQRIIIKIVMEPDSGSVRIGETGMSIHDDSGHVYLEIAEASQLLLEYRSASTCFFVIDKSVGVTAVPIAPGSDL